MVLLDCNSSKLQTARRMATPHKNRISAAPVPIMPPTKTKVPPALMSKSCSAAAMSTADVTETTAASTASGYSSSPTKKPQQTAHAGRARHDAATTTRGPVSMPAGLALAAHREAVGGAEGAFPPISFRLWDRYNRLRGQDDILACVSLPPDEFLAGWVAVHLIDFYKDVVSVWDVIARDMSARLYLGRFRPGEGYPPGAMYFLEGAQTGGGAGAAVGERSPLIPAPVYAMETIRWIKDQVDGRDMNHLALDRDEEARIFRAYEHCNPRFAMLSGKIIRRLFRVYGIIYCSMYRIVERLQIAPYLNEVFERFMFFCFEFGLLSKKETEPLEKLVGPMLKRYRLSKDKAEAEQRRQRSPSLLPVRVCGEDVSVASSGGTLERAPFCRKTKAKAATFNVRLLDNARMQQCGQEVVISPSAGNDSLERSPTDEMGYSSHGSPVIGKAPHFGYF